MIQVIHGKKGSGKTKRILDQANEAIKEHKGDVIFIDDDNRYMYDLRHEVRFVNAGEYGSDSPEMFFGFLCGMLAAVAASKLSPKPSDEVEALFDRAVSTLDE